MKYRDKNSRLSRVLVAHICNPSYSGGRDQKVRSQPGQIVPETLS
jgi:hypothetical protein